MGVHADTATVCAAYNPEEIGAPLRVYWAVVKGRYGVGIELKDSYFQLQKRVMEMAKVQSVTFDFINEM